MRARSLRVDVLWAAALAVAALFVTAKLRPPGEKPADALVAAAIAGLVVLGVRRWPAPILALLGLFVVFHGVPAALVVPCMLVVLGVVAYRHSWRAAGIGWAMTYFAMLTVAGFFMPPKGTELLQAFAEAGLAAAPVAFGRYLRGVHNGRRWPGSGLPRMRRGGTRSPAPAASRSARAWPTTCTTSLLTTSAL